MPDDVRAYPILEPNHDVRVDDEGYHIVLCPFEVLDDGSVVMHEQPVTQTATWSPNAEPDEIDCPRCELFNGALHFAGPPPHEHEGEDDVDTDPPVAGGSHGGVHHISEYSPCKVPLRRIKWCDVSILVHEGAIPSLRRIEAGWRRLGGADFYVIRQRVTAFYVCRKTVSGRSWSIHSICAGDVNWDRNPYGRNLVTDMPPKFRQLFLDEGWGWGGNWRSVKDAMHFSKAVHEGGDGRLYVGEEEEDDLPYTEKQLEEIVKRGSEANFDDGDAHKGQGSKAHRTWKSVQKTLKRRNPETGEMESVIVGLDRLVQAAWELDHPGQDYEATMAKAIFG